MQLLAPSRASVALRRWCGCLVECLVSFCVSDVVGDSIVYSQKTRRAMREKSGFRDGAQGFHPDPTPQTACSVFGPAPRVFIRIPDPTPLDIQASRLDSSHGLAAALLTWVKFLPGSRTCRRPLPPVSAASGSETLPAGTLRVLSNLSPCGNQVLGDHT